MRTFTMILLIIASLTICAKESNTSVKFYPLAFSFGKLYYCSDFKLGIEHRFKVMHRFEIAGNFSFPNFRFLLGKMMASVLTDRNNILYLYGGGGCISYKYDLNKKNLYIGAKLSSSIYKTIGTISTNYNSRYEWNQGTSSQPYKINLYMNSANFIFGWSSKTKSGIDLALEIGYRYNRGYYLINGQAIEINRDRTIYTYLRFPLRVGIDMSINLNTCFDKKYKKEKKDFWFKE